MMYPTTGSRANPNNSIKRKMLVLMPSSQVTARVNGGKLNVIGSPVRRTELPLDQFYSDVGAPGLATFARPGGLRDPQPFSAPEPARPAGSYAQHGRPPAPRR